MLLVFRPARLRERGRRLPTGHFENHAAGRDTAAIVAAIALSAGGGVSAALGTFGNDSLAGGQGDDFLNGDLPFPPGDDGSTPPGAFGDPTPGNTDTCEGGAGTDAETFCELQTSIETHPDPSTVIVPA